MSGINDFFDGRRFPQRPDTPDFWRLSEIILQMDGAMDAAQNDDEREAVWNDFVLSHISGDALYYLAYQRACRAVGATTIGGVSKHRHEITRLIVLYSEAFAVGVAYQQRGGQPAPTTEGD